MRRCGSLPGQQALRVSRAAPGNVVDDLGESDLLNGMPHQHVHQTGGEHFQLACRAAASQGAIVRHTLGNAEPCGAGKPENPVIAQNVTGIIAEQPPTERDDA
ncbi:Uncharacterised protein [Mycobacteroides abscessus subsp. massiliense]|nr:Uncharacterised protein [Mycobacteroides abscessus subsp. massiliense]SKO11483.1 Uncharacterised protein [Mycobacteroides abscessus subsp. massiliense]